MISHRIPRAKWSVRVAVAAVSAWVGLIGACNAISSVPNLSVADGDAANEAGSDDARVPSSDAPLDRWGSGPGLQCDAGGRPQKLWWVRP